MSVEKNKIVQTKTTVNLDVLSQFGWPSFVLLVQRRSIGLLVLERKLADTSSATLLFLSSQTFFK
eukprot:3623041-Amphidinium_carterae.1